MSLHVENLTKKFGGVTAVNNLSFSINQGTITGLIGPNGSGKTTVFNLITGFEKLDGGRIVFNGRQIAGLKPYQIARLGICRTFQLTRVFGQMTVLENLVAASPIDVRSSVVRAEELLKSLEIANLTNTYGRNLSYGQQRLIEIAKVLMRDPEYLLLDEPTSGVNPVLIQKLLDIMIRLREQGKTILIVEHNIPIICEVCQNVVVLNYGEKIAEGNPREIQCDRRVIDAYLGSGLIVGGPNA